MMQGACKMQSKCTPCLSINTAHYAATKSQIQQRLEVTKPAKYFRSITIKFQQYVCNLLARMHQL